MSVEFCGIGEYSDGSTGIVTNGSTIKCGPGGLYLRDPPLANLTNLEPCQEPKHPECSAVCTVDGELYAPPVPCIGEGTFEYSFAGPVNLEIGESNQIEQIQTLTNTHSCYTKLFTLWITGSATAFRSGDFLMYPLFRIEVNGVPIGGNANGYSMQQQGVKVQKAAVGPLLYRAVLLPGETQQLPISLVIQNFGSDGDMGVEDFLITTKTTSIAAATCQEKEE